MKYYVSQRWSFRPDLRTLTRVGDSPVTLPHQASQVLDLLCQRSGDLLSSNELIDEIWQGDVRVGDHGLRQIIWRLRREIPADASGQPAIINVPRKGYRLRDEVTPSDLSLPGRRRRLLGVLLATTAMLGLLFFVGSREKSTVLDKQLSVRQATAQAGYEESPALSPDQRYLLYSDDRNGSFDIYLRDLRDPEPADQLLIQDPRPLGGMSWAGDGQRFAYLRGTDQPTVQEILVYDLRTSQTLSIGEQRSPNFSRVPHGIAWSPVDERIAFSGPVGPGRLLALFTHDLASGERQQLTEPAFLDLHPAWSPNGTKLSFLRLINPELSGQYVLDLSTGNVHEVTPGNTKVYGSAWLDERRLLYGAYRHGYFYPFVVDIESLERVQLEIPGNFKYPNLSGGEIHYVRSALERQIQVHGVREGGLALEEVLDSGMDQEEPTIHLATGRLVFTSDRTGHRELWYRAETGAALVQLSNEATAVNYPSFSRSGDKLMFRRFNAASDQVELVLADLNEHRVLDQPVIASFFGLFAGADRYIAYLTIAAEGRELWVYDMVTDQHRHLDDGVWTIFGADQDRCWIYYLKSRQLHRFDLVTGQGSVLPHELPEGAPAYQQGRNRYFFREHAAGAELLSMDLESGQEQSHLSIPLTLYRQLSEFAFDPTTELLYLSVYRKRESDLFSLSRDELEGLLRQALP